MVAAFFWALSKQQLHNFFLNRNFFSVRCSGGSSSVEPTSGQKKIRRKKIFFSDDEKEKNIRSEKDETHFFCKNGEITEIYFPLLSSVIKFFLQKNGDGAFLDWILTSLTVINGRRTVTKNYNYNYRIEKSWFKKAVWKNRFPEESFRSGSTSCPWPSSCWTCSWWRQPCRRLRCSRGCRYRLKKENTTLDGSLGWNLCRIGPI